MRHNEKIADFITRRMYEHIDMDTSDQADPEHARAFVDLNDGATLQKYLLWAIEEVCDNDEVNMEVVTTDPKTCDNCASTLGHNNSSGDFQCDNCGHDEGDNN